MPLPLLRLPLLTSIKVIKNMDIRYLISLIQLSTKMRNLAKVSKVHIKLIVFPSSIRFERLVEPGKSMSIAFLCRSAPTGNQSFKPFYNRCGGNKCKNEIKGYKKLIDDFMDTFIIHSISFDLGIASTYTACCYLEYAKSVGLKFSFVQTTISPEKTESYKNLLRVCSNASELSVFFSRMETFEFNGFNQYKMDVFRLTILSHSFDLFTVGHMCSLLNCLRVEVSMLNWNNEDFNRLLKFWMASDGRLRSVVLFNNKKMRSEIVMREINRRELVPNEAFEIQRNDGLKAKVTLDDKIFSLEVINT